MLASITMSTEKLESSRVSYLGVIESLNSAQLEMLEWIWEYHCSHSIGREKWPPCHKFHLKFPADSECGTTRELEELTGNLILSRTESGTRIYELRHIGILSVPSVSLNDIVAFLRYAKGFVSEDFEEKIVPFIEVASELGLGANDVIKLKRIFQSGWLLIGGIAWRDDEVVFRASEELTHLHNASSELEYLFSIALKDWDPNLPVSSELRSNYENGYDYYQVSEVEGYKEEILAHRFLLFGKTKTSVSLPYFCVAIFLGIFLLLVFTVPSLSSAMPGNYKIIAILTSAIITVSSLLLGINFQAYTKKRIKARVKKKYHDSLGRVIKKYNAASHDSIEEFCEVLSGEKL